jgi:hypothetical protein
MFVNLSDTSLEIGRGNPWVKFQLTPQVPSKTLTPAKGKGFPRVGVKVYRGWRGTEYCSGLFYNNI